MHRPAEGRHPELRQQRVFGAIEAVTTDTVPGPPDAQGEVGVNNNR